MSHIPDAHNVAASPLVSVSRGDSWFAPWRQAVEYEGIQHQEDRDQYNADIDRYLIFRTMRAPYLQVTKERMRRPRLAITQIHRARVTLHA